MFCSSVWSFSLCFDKAKIQNGAVGAPPPCERSRTDSRFAEMHANMLLNTLSAAEMELTAAEKKRIKLRSKLSAWLYETHTVGDIS